MLGCRLLNNEDCFQIVHHSAYSLKLEQEDLAILSLYHSTAIPISTLLDFIIYNMQLLDASIAVENEWYDRSMQLRGCYTGMQVYVEGFSIGLAKVREGLLLIQF